MLPVSVFTVQAFYPEEGTVSLSETLYLSLYSTQVQINEAKQVISNSDTRISVMQVPKSQLGTCECGNEPSGSIKCGEFLD